MELIIDGETKSFKTWSDYSNWFIETYPELYDRVSDVFVIEEKSGKNTADEEV